jgi:hypothetical protein
MSLAESSQTAVSFDTLMAPKYEYNITIIFEFKEIIFFLTNELQNTGHTNCFATRREAA